MAYLPVLIVGAGPTGLALAAEFARFGLAYRLIDRSLQPAQWSRALVVQARTLEQFERYSIAETAVARGRTIRSATITSEQRPVLHLDFDSIRSRYPFILFLPQNETERLLTEHLNSVGGQIEHGVELVSFEQFGDHIDATLQHADGQTERISASWVVGCDGAHSVVRRAINVPFEGTAVDFVFFLGDLHISGKDTPGDELRVYLQHGNIVFIGRLSETVYRVIVALHQEQEADPHNERPLTLVDFQQAVDKCVGAGMQLSDPTWITRFRINQRKASKYRVGRAFLAGDASHIHSPVAGQGMNTGIQDAANLAWKLAAVMHGAPDALLDTYDEERGAVGDALLAATGRGLSAALLANPTLEAIRDRILGLLGGLAFVQERARGFMSETAIQYRHSSIVQDCGGSSPLRAGDRAPDGVLGELNDTAPRLYERLAVPIHILIALDVSKAQLATLSQIWPERATLALSSTTSKELAHTYGNNGKPIVYAIRPDGYIGFRGDLDNIAALRDYTQRVGIVRTGAQ